MSYSNKHKKYITIEDVRVSYKKKDDSIHITSTDPDLAADGFHMFVNKDTPTETILRRLLIEHEVITPELANSMYGQEHTVFKSKLREPRRVPLTNGKGAIVSIASAGSGTGKTSISINLALHLAKLTNPTTGRKFSVAVVDMDVRDGRIREILSGDDTVPTMETFYDTPEATDMNIMNCLVYNASLGIHALYAPKNARITESFDNAFYTRILSSLSTHFDFVIVDTISTQIESQASRSAFDLSNLILLVVTPVMSVLRHTEQWVNSLDSLLTDHNVDKDKIGVVVNQFMANEHSNTGISRNINIATHFLPEVETLVYSKKLHIAEEKSSEERARFFESEFSNYHNFMIRLARKVAQV